ncbi:MAG: Rpn family recombination-promoting nuclease/putative transposase [Treponema sp.]|nr:Rpn family recombination-promoting nuclease/putative transposase [Treponema sp.]
MAGKSILHVKNDAVFRMFFADERNQDSLIAFLKSILKLPDDEYDEIIITDPHLLPEHEDGKLGIIDVKLRTKSSKVIHIEIQLKKIPEMKERIVFYDAKLITEQLKQGDKYTKINQVISIIITNKTLVEGSSRYHHRFTLYDLDVKIEFRRNGLSGN